MEISFLVNAIRDGAFVGLTGGFLVWFTGYCISKVITFFKTISS